CVVALVLVREHAARRLAPFLRLVEPADRERRVETDFLVGIGLHERAERLDGALVPDLEERLHGGDPDARIPVPQRPARAVGGRPPCRASRAPGGSRAAAPGRRSRTPAAAPGARSGPSA